MRRCHHQARHGDVAVAEKESLTEIFVCAGKSLNTMARNTGAIIGKTAANTNVKQDFRTQKGEEILPLFCIFCRARQN